MTISFEPGRSAIVCVGSALVDMLAGEDDSFLEAVGAAKGGMTLVEQTFIDDLVSKTANPPTVVSGGSACNTSVGVGCLGGAARFVGKRGEDELGDVFESDLVAQRVEPYLFRSASPTGRVLSVITPDAQRTMFTYLGASAEMQPAEITQKCFDSAAIVHVEGYLLFNPDLMMAVLKAAKASGARISLDLASFNVVEESRELLNDIVADYIDILIANEDEAFAYTGIKDEASSLKELGRNTEIAVLKTGPRGSMILHKGETTRVEALGDGCAVDTTGAGDLWAAGFLFGLVSGYSFTKSGNLGSACGYEVCQLVGAKVEEAGWQRIKQLLAENA
ncbi:MAG: adenosine kinase [Desulfobacterales bacterium]|nr:adenosine kinase [Desulfobacterales bacterium]